MKSEVVGKQKVMKAHPAPAGEASAAQGAAKPPQDDKEAQGKAANAEKMNAAKPGEFNKAAFVKAVNDAIAAQAPKNLDEADKFGESGKAAAVKGQVQGQVSAGKKTSAGPIETTTNAPPDTAAAKEKPVTPLRPDQPPPAPAPPDAANAVPDKAPASATDFSDGPKQVDAQMADAQVTEDQLARSNEPEFTGALKEKKEGEQHAATAPGQVRAAESATLAGARGQAASAGSSAMTALAADRKQAGAAVAGGKEGAKGKDEAQRAQVTAKLQKVFDATKKDVEDILSGLDKKVDEKFTAGEKAVRDAFTAEHKRKMDAYKDRRYSGWLGAARWVKDKFTGLPEEANQIFVQARQGYVNGMQKVISDVADIIGAELTRAKTRIATGRNELQAAVASLSPELQAIGKQAAGEFAGKFDELTESVDAKGKELVNTLATKYNEALKSVDEEIAAEKEKNKGLVAKAMDAVKGVIDTILKLKDLLMGVLAKAASAVAAIIKDPIGFLGHLVSAVGAGLRAFLANIGEHLKKGLVGWLMGAMAGAGLQLPAKFDLRGIIMMIGSLLGLTWSAIRGRIVQRGVPEQAMGAVEKSVEIVPKLQSEGIGGIWETIKEKVGDLKANLFSKISEYLIPTVLIAGITWIISLLNPASAFVKAVKMIIDIVTFIIERGAQIIAFVNSVLDAIIAIAAGGTGGVPTLIETALATSIPVLIGALAAILGISGIADKIKKFLQSLSKPIMKAVDWIVDKIVKLGKKIWNKIKGKLGKGDKPDPARERAAIADAGKALKSAEDHDQARQKISTIERRHHVPLHLVVDSRTPDGEVVHVQTMATPPQQLGGGAKQQYKRLRDSLHEVRAQMGLDLMKQRLGGRGGLRELPELVRKVNAWGSAKEANLIRYYTGSTDPSDSLARDEDETALDALEKQTRMKFTKLMAVLQNAIGVEQVRNRKECRDLLKRMQEMRGELDDLERKVLVSMSHRSQIEGALKTITDTMKELITIGKGHGYKSIETLDHPSDYVIGGEIIRRIDIRKKFYPKAYSDATNDWRDNNKLPDLVRAAQKDHPELAGQPGYGSAGYFYCDWEKHLAPKSSATLDHKDTPVAAHWNDKGRFGGHDMREDFYSWTGNLQILCGPCNSQKGSGGITYLRQVGPDFTGPGEG